MARKTLVSTAAALALAALALTGCSSSSSSDSPGSAGSSASPGASQSAGAATDSISITVSSGRISPKPAVHQVHLGDQLRLTVTSDKPDEAHLHGYDKEIELQPGKPGTISVKADIPGIFEFETHKSNLQLLQIEVK
jgi:hypothetical protein